MISKIEFIGGMYLLQEFIRRMMELLLIVENEENLLCVEMT